MYFARNIRNKILLGVGFASNSYGFNNLSLSEWDFNWDCPDKETKGIHYIVLVRHGQYSSGKDDDVDRVLTSLGQKQATATGIRLKEILEANNIPKINRMYHSTMIRAKQTSDIILSHLPVKLDQPGQYQPCSMIREGACFRPIPSISKERWNVSDKDFFRDEPRIEAAFKYHIHRADNDESYSTILVCHGNVIRYIVCRALQLNPEAWLRFSVANSSITILKIMPSGNVSLVSMGESGHMKPQEITFN